MTDSLIAQARRFACSRTDGVFSSTWVSVTGELDAASAPELDQMVRRAQLDVRLVVLDLRDLVFIDCAGRHVVLNAAMRARREAERLVVVKGAPHVHRVFVLTECSGLLEITEVDPFQPSNDALRRLAREPVPPALPQTPRRDEQGASHNFASFPRSAT